MVQSEAKKLPWLPNLSRKALLSSESSVSVTGSSEIQGGRVEGTPWPSLIGNKLTILRRLVDENNVTDHKKG